MELICNSSCSTSFPLNPFSSLFFCTIFKSMHVFQWIVFKFGVSCLVHWFIFERIVSNIVNAFGVLAAVS